MPRAQIFGLQLSCLPHVCIARSLALALVALRYAGPRRRPLLQHLQQIDRGSRCRRAPLGVHAWSGAYFQECVAPLAVAPWLARLPVGRARAGKCKAM